MISIFTDKSRRLWMSLVLALTVSLGLVGIAYGSQVFTETVGFSNTITETLTYGQTSVPVQGAIAPTYGFVNGTGAGKVNLHYEHTFTLASSANTTLTLSSLTDDLGRSVSFAKVRKFYIYLSTVTDGDYLTVGNAGSNPWVSFLGGTTPTVKVTDALLLVSKGTAGYAVSSGTADQLKITNSGSNSITFAIGLSGE